MVKSQKFIVGVECTIGEYEKRTIHLIEAETREQAMLQALADESHGNANFDADCIWWDMFGEMAYKVDHCSIITEEVAKTFTDTGVFFVSTWCPDQIEDMLSDDAEKDIDTLLGYLD